MVFFSPVAFSIAISNSTSVVIPLFSAHAVGTSVNIIVSDNNIAKIRCFITFTSYISFYLIRFRGFKQKTDTFKTWFYPCLKAPLLYILRTAQGSKRRLLCPGLFCFSELAGASCASEPLRGQRGAMEPGGMAAVRRWQLAGPEGPVALRRRLTPGLPINFT